MPIVVAVLSTIGSAVGVGTAAGAVGATAAAVTAATVTGAAIVGGVGLAAASTIQGMQQSAKAGKAAEEAQRKQEEAAAQSAAAAEETKKELEATQQEIADAETTAELEAKEQAKRLQRRASKTILTSPLGAEQSGISTQRTLLGQ